MSRSTSMFVAGVLVGAVLATVGFSLFLRGQGSDGGASSQMVLKLGHGLDTGHPVHKAMEFMKQRLEELSGGTVTVDIYPSSVLGSETQCIEQLQNRGGAAEFCHGRGAVGHLSRVACGLPKAYTGNGLGLRQVQGPDQFRRHISSQCGLRVPGDCHARLPLRGSHGSQLPALPRQ